MADTWNILIHDNDCHWYVIKQSERADFLEWVDAQENYEETDGTRHDYNANRVDDPSKVRFKDFEWDV